MTNHYLTHAPGGTDLATLDLIEKTGEVYHSWEVMELIQELEEKELAEFAERDRQKHEQQALEELEALEREKRKQEALEELEALQGQSQTPILGEQPFDPLEMTASVDDPPPILIDPERLATYKRELLDLGRELKWNCQSLQQALTPVLTGPEVQFPRTAAEVQEHIEQIHQLMMPIMNLTYKYQDLLVATDRRDSITHCYYQRGLIYSANYLAQRATLTALQAEFRTALRPHIVLERIYRYLEQLPSLYYSLTNRLLETLGEQVSEPPLALETHQNTAPNLFNLEPSTQEETEINEILDS